MSRALEIAERLERAITESGGIDLRDPDLLRQAAALLRAQTDWARTWKLGDNDDMDTPVNWMKRALEAEERWEVAESEAEDRRFY